MVMSERRGVYLHEGMSDLRVANPHFDFRDEFDAALRLGGVTESIEQRLLANFSTAVSEDVLRRGHFSLEFYESDNGRPLLTTQDHRAFGDLTFLTLKGVKKRRKEGKPYTRELAELQGIRELRRQSFDCPDGTQFVLIYPTGPKEDGYSGVSLTYIYRAEGPPGPGRKLRVVFYKNALTLEGYAQLYRTLERGSSSREHDYSPEFFVSHPIDISDHPMIQTVDDVTTEIDGIANRDRRFADRSIGFGSTLSADVFVRYEPQLAESARFLVDTLEEKLHSHVAGLDQQALADLELAYSFARRAVGVFAERGVLVSTRDLKEDYEWNRRIERSIVFDDVRTGSSMESIVGDLMRLQTHFLDRYGDVHERKVGGIGCPPGMLQSIGVSLDGFSIPTLGDVSFETEENKWSYHSGTCRVCKTEHTQVGPCEICKVCEKTFD